MDQSCVYNIKSHLSAPLFTADLEKGKPGSFDFGFINDSRHTGNIAYVPVDTNLGYWGFTVNGYAIGTDEFKSIPIKVVADTGSSLNSLPKTIVDAYYAGVSGAAYTAIHEGYTFPCGSTLPNITFNIGNYNAVVPGYFMNYSTYSFKNTSMFPQIPTSMLKTNRNVNFYQLAMAEFRQLGTLDHSFSVTSLSNRNSSFLMLVKTHVSDSLLSLYEDIYLSAQ